MVAITSALFEFALGLGLKAAYQEACLGRSGQKREPAQLALADGQIALAAQQGAPSAGSAVYAT